MTSDSEALRGSGQPPTGGDATLSGSVTDASILFDRSVGAEFLNVKPIKNDCSSGALNSSRTDDVNNMTVNSNSDIGNSGRGGGNKDGRPSMSLKQPSAVDGLLAEGADIRKIHTVDENLDEEVKKQELRRKARWRGREEANRAGIQYDFALQTFDYKIQAMVLVADLRLYVIFIVMFCFFFMVERNITGNSFFVIAIRDPIITNEEKPAIISPRFWPDVNGAGDWSKWMDWLFAPQMLNDPPIIGPNYLVGAARMRTLRVRPDSCSVNPYVIPNSMAAETQVCYGPWSSSHEDAKSVDNRYNKVTKWEYKSCRDMKHGSVITGQLGTYHCGGFHFEIPFWQENDGSVAQVPFVATKTHRLTTQDEAQELYVRPRVYNDPPFADNLATRFAALEFFVYSPELRTFLSAKFFVEVAQGGLWKAQHQVRVFQVWTRMQVGKTVYDFFFFAFVLYYLYDFLHDLIRFRRKEGKTLAFFFDTWNFLELVDIAIFLCVFSFRWLWWGTCMTNNLALADLVYAQRYPVELEDILAYYMLQVYLNSVNTTLVFLKLLKFLRLNDRLNILSRTLAESQDSIIGVLFIFFLIVTAFAMTGHGLFGLGIWSYRSIDASFSTLALVLLGQFDYTSMKNENRVLAGFFFWGYIILALFCMLNFLIGVLTEAFSAVNATQTVLPLEETLARTWREILFLYSPAALKKQIVENIKGNSREHLLQDAMDHLTEYRKTLYPEDGVDVPDPDKQLIYKRHIWAAIPSSLMDKLGEKYLEYIWEDLVYEFDRSHLADGAILQQRNLEAATKGVKNTLAFHLELVETFAPRMQELDRNLNKLAELLEEQSN